MEPFFGPGKRFCPCTAALQIKHAQQNVADAQLPGSLPTLVAQLFLPFYKSGAAKNSASQHSVLCISFQTSLRLLHQSVRWCGSSPLSHCLIGKLPGSKQKLCILSTCTTSWEVASCFGNSGLPKGTGHLSVARSIQCCELGGWLWLSSGSSYVSVAVRNHTFSESSNS